MNNKLVVYCKGNREKMEIKYGKENTTFINSSRWGGVDTLQGMRFSTIIIEEDISAEECDIIKGKFGI